jgi:hypothetical protein
MKDNDRHCKLEKNEQCIHIIGEESPRDETVGGQGVDGMTILKPFLYKQGDKVFWTHRAEHIDRCSARLNTVMYIRVP